MYLLDTNIVIFFFKGKFNLHTLINRVGSGNCFISEITFAELLYGAKKSANPVSHTNQVLAFVETIAMIPISGALEVYAEERARLESLGTPIDDFDLLIGATAIANNLTLVTNNTKHFSRLRQIKIEDWTQ